MSYTTLKSRNNYDNRDDTIHITNGAARVSLGIDFGSQGLGSEWTTLEPTQARDLANALIKHADAVEQGA